MVRDYHYPGIPHRVAATMGAWILTVCVSGAASAQTRPAVATPTDGRSVVLAGKVVTMNAAREVLNPGLVWVHNGLIVAVGRDSNALEAAVANEALKQELQRAPMMHLTGVIYPGMIDLHNHPEYAIYPLLPVKRKYRDRYEWRFYDNDYARRITNLNTLLTAPHYLDLGVDVGRYGEYKALMGGTTTLQGSRTSLPSARDECLVRNIETSAVTPRLAFSRVDIGRDAAEWQRMAEERLRGPLVIHLAEGVGARMAGEFDAVKRSGLLGPELVAIHAVGLTAAQFGEMATAGAKLVWSPLSNFMLYGQTADVRAAKEAGVGISLAPDWTPSGSKSILGELKVADLVNQHQLKRLFTDRELVEMVTVNPANAIGWQQQLGQISPGYLADIVVVDRLVDDPYRNLIVAIEENIQLVMVRGESLYGDKALLTVLRAARQLESLPPIGVLSNSDAAGTAARRIKMIAPNCQGSALPETSVEDVSVRIQQAFRLNAAQIAKRVSAEQFAKDLRLCGTEYHGGAPTAADAKRLLACRFELPFEQTLLSPLTTNADPQFFTRLNANPNLPRYLKRLADYYKPAQGAKRSIRQAVPVKR